MNPWEWYAAAVGLTMVVTFSALGDLVRDRLPLSLSPFLSCPQCVGFWAGAFVGILRGLGWHSILMGLAVSVVSRLVAALIEKAER